MSRGLFVFLFLFFFFFWLSRILARMRVVLRLLVFTVCDEIGRNIMRNR